MITHVEKVLDVAQLFQLLKFQGGSPYTTTRETFVESLTCSLVIDNFNAMVGGPGIQRITVCGKGAIPRLASQCSMWPLNNNFFIIYLAILDNEKQWENDGWDVNNVDIDSTHGKWGHAKNDKDDPLSNVVIIVMTPFIFQIVFLLTFVLLERLWHMLVFRKKIIYVNFNKQCFQVVFTGIWYQIQDKIINNIVVTLGLDNVVQAGYNDNKD